MARIPRASFSSHEIQLEGPAHQTGTSMITVKEAPTHGGVFRGVICAPYKFEPALLDLVLVPRNPVHPHTVPPDLKADVRSHSLRENGDART